MCESFWVCECEVCDEDGHGEADAGETGCAGEVTPGCCSWERADAEFDGDPAREDDAERLTDEQPDDDAQWYWSCEFVESDAFESYAGVCECEDGDDEEGDPRGEGGFESVEG